jgi:hypothetical protein
VPWSNKQDTRWKIRLIAGSIVASGLFAGVSIVAVIALVDSLFGQ